MLLPLLSSGSTVFPSTIIINSSGAPIFEIAAQGTLPDYLVLVASGAYASGPSGLYIFAYF